MLYIKLSFWRVLFILSSSANINHGVTTIGIRAYQFPNNVLISSGYTPSELDTHKAADTQKASTQVDEELDGEVRLDMNANTDTV